MTRFRWLVPVLTGPASDPARPFAGYEQIALGADQAGFDALVIPYDTAGDDSVVVGAAVARITRQIAVDIELQPGSGSPVYLAKLFASLQRATGGRIALSLRDRADAGFAASIGETLTDADHEARLREFVEVFYGIWNETATAPGTAARVDYDGTYFQVAGGGLTGILSGTAAPRLSLPSGVVSVPADVVVAPVPVDDADPFPDARTAERALSAAVLARDDAEEAWADLDEALRRAGVDVDVAALRVGSTLWTGFHLLGLRDAVGVVGSHEEVAATLQELGRRHGADEFVLSGLDPIADLYRAAEHILHRVDSGRRMGVAA